MVMAKTIKIELSRKELQKWAGKTQEWAKKVDIAGKNLVQDLAELTKTEMENNFNSQTVKTITPMSFEIEKNNDYTRTVKMIGTQAIYNEFGTGTEGEESPHPKKTEFGLNPYNSGPTIRKALTDMETEEGKIISVGDLYWTYLDERGIWTPTQGIPAQKVVYNAAKVARQKMPELAEKRLKEVFEV